MISVVAINNRAAESQGSDQILDQTPILHAKYFAHMINLVLVNTWPDGHLAQIMDECRYAQSTFSRGRVTDTIH
jgi:hypothetical protein